MSRSNTITERFTTKSIFQVLRERICLLDYPPSTVLREATLASEFGVSRTPIRTALQQLAHAGLIESRDGVENIVTDPDFTEIQNIYEMRLKIAELIGQLTPKPVLPQYQQSAERLCLRANMLIERFDIQQYWQINHELHSLIGDLIGNSALRKIWDSLYFQSTRIWYRHALAFPSNVAAALVSALNEVSQAFTENDATALGYIQRNHIAYGLQRLISEQHRADA